MAVALLVLPLRSGKVLRTGLENYLRSLIRLLAAVHEQVGDLGARLSLRDEIRDLDACYQTVHAIGIPGNFIRRTGRPEEAALDAVTRTRADIRSVAAEVERIEAARAMAGQARGS